MNSRYPAVQYGSESAEWSWWSGEQLRGPVERPIAFDTETELIESPLVIPRVALGMAYDGQRLVLIHPAKLAEFIAVHRKQHLVCHNLVFDWWVLHEHFDGRAEQRIMWDLTKADRWHCSLILNQLLQLATGRYAGPSGGPGEQKRLWPVNLSVAAECEGLTPLDKDDPYRMRFGELLDLSVEQMECHAEFEGFVSYALKDVMATYRVYERQRLRAAKLVAQVGLAPNQTAKGYQILPGAFEKWGPLTEAIQVKGAIVLEEMSRHPLPIDQEERAKLEAAAREQYQTAFAYMDAECPGLFKRASQRARTNPGAIKLTKTGLVPQMDQKVLKAKLEAIAAEKSFPVPLSDGKKPGISTSTKSWSKLAHQHQFIEQWIHLEDWAKQLEFLQTLAHPAVYSRYSLLMRTGRTSAGKWTAGKKRILPSLNIQQMPREGEFRNVFKAPAGKEYVIVDYSYIELRTLAASAYARYGFSKLKDAVVGHTKQGGLDPHQIMAATMLDVDEDEFRSLPKDVQKSARQKAKACFHPDTELLTRRGWMKITDVTMDDEVAQFWPGWDRIDYAKPLALTTRDDQPLVRIHNEGIDIRVTPDHRVLGFGQNDNPRVVKAVDINTLNGIWNAGRYELGKRIGALNTQYVREMVCIQADGSYAKTRTKFGFKKQRKIERFKTMFPEASTSYSEKWEVTSFSIPYKPIYNVLLDENKVWKIENLLKMPFSYREAFIDELRYWDGGSISKTTKRFSYYTTIKANADAVQAVATVTGYKASIARQVSTKENHKDVYIVSIKNRSYTRGENFNVDSLDGLHKVYCLSMPSSYVVARDGGKTVCIGQCNFGFGGGLGVETFRAYAAGQYNSHFSKEEAKAAKKKWIERYSEMKLWLCDRTAHGLRYHLGDAINPLLAKISEAGLRLVSDLLRKSPNMAPRAKDAAWSILEDLCSAARRFDLLEDVEERKLTRRLCEITTDYAATLTGRIRANTGYTEINTLFQGTAADGAKLSLFELRYRGYKPVIFVHDEIVCEVEASEAAREVKRISQIMNSQMETVLDGVPCAVEGHHATSWVKE